jgi:ectoine hydroxylase-related dioxygenase (phytanoyl-CoA dioxygenase family)
MAQWYLLYKHGFVVLAMIRSVFAGVWDLFCQVLSDKHAELEPSFFIYALEAPQDAPAIRTKRMAYLGGNFGLPHRDHSHVEANDEQGNPKIVSVWIPVTDATVENGCMYVIDKEDDVNFDRPNEYAHMRSALQQDVRNDGTTEATSRATVLRFDMSCARPLVVGAGSVCAWYGNLIHWGSQCSRYAPVPRVSITCTFRRRDAAPTHLQGQMGSLRFAELAVCVPRTLTP